MENKLSKRLAEIVDSLSLWPEIRILEIGCGPGAMARELSRRIDGGYILAMDRSIKAIQQAKAGLNAKTAKGNLEFQQGAIEQFKWDSNTPLFDIAIAIRVGALDGRHPEIEEEALLRIAQALKPEGKLYIDGGNPLR